MSEVAAPREGLAAEDERVERRDERAKSDAASLSRRITLAAIGTLLTAAATAVGLLFQLFPGLTPDPQARLDAEIAVGPVEGHVWYSDFHRRIEHPFADVSPSVNPGDTWGYVFYIRMKTEGLKHHPSTLTWRLYDRDSGRWVRDWNGGLAQMAIARQSTPSDTIVDQVWVQPPAGPGRYFVRFVLYAKANDLLATADSPAFPGCRAIGCGAPSTIKKAPRHFKHR